jgi:hypothetical protein
MMAASSPGAMARMVSWVISLFALEAGCPVSRDARVASLVQHCKDMHAIVSQDMEDHVGKAPQEGASGVPMNRGMPQWLLGDALEGAINSF